MAAVGGGRSLSSEGLAAVPMQENRLTGGSMASSAEVRGGQRLCVCSAKRCQHNICRCDVFSLLMSAIPLIFFPPPFFQTKCTQA